MVVGGGGVVVGSGGVVVGGGGVFDVFVMFEYHFVYDFEKHDIDGIHIPFIPVVYQLIQCMFSRFVDIFFKRFDT